MVRELYAFSDRSDRVEVLIFADLDDEATQCVCREDGLFCLTGKRASMGSYLRQLFAVSRGSIIFLLNDDVAVRTKGWDSILCDLYVARITPLLAYPNDLFKKARLCTFPILDRRSFEIIFDFSMERYRGAFIDTHLQDIFLRLSKAGQGEVRFLPEVVFEHLHYRLNKSDFDETYAFRDRFGDDETYLQLAPSRRSIAGLLGAGASRDGLDQTLAPSCGSSLWLYFRQVARTLLCDPDLPLGWRTRMTGYFLLRYAYRRLLNAPQACKPV